MIYMAQLDIVIRVSAATVMLLLAARLTFRRDVGRPAVLFVALAICMAGFLGGNTPDPSLRLAGLAGDIAHVLSAYAAVFIWWFCLACFDRDEPLRGIPLITGIVWIAIASIDRGLLGQRFADAELSRALIIMGFGIVAHLAWALLRDRAGDLLDSRRDARVMVVILLGGQLLADLLADLFMGFGWRPELFAIAQNASVLAFGIWLSARLASVNPDILTFRTRQIMPPPGPATPGHDREVDAALHARLRALIEHEHVHLDAQLSFDDFVRLMGAPDRAVRDLINRQLGHDHFRAFLNHHRLIEARRLLADPARCDDKLIAISLDSGFASLASFNRVFRAVEGCTPSEFRKASTGPVIFPPERRAQGRF